MNREQNNFKPRRVRIYKLSTFDTLTYKERKFNNAYKEVNAFLKKQRDELSLRTVVLEKLKEVAYIYTIMTVMGT